jgi:hypothetical protein
MKKVFKMMVCALAACSLFVACGDEEETEKDGIKVAFGEESWKAADILGVDYSTVAGVVQLGAFKDLESTTTPYVQGYVPHTPSTVTYNAANNYYYMFYYENDNDYTPGINRSGDTVNYPNWQPYSFTEEITAIDLTALTISGNCSGTLYSYPEAVAANSVENATKKDLSVTINNATWENAVSKGKNFKTMGTLAK